MNTDYKLISKNLYFPDKEILVIGDLHIGYDYMIQQSGVLIPENQVQEIIKELEQILSQLKNKVKKIIFLGDIKHSFSYEWKEKNYFNEILDFLKTRFKDENIILIKGNHDTIDYSFSGKLKDYHIEDNIAFTHGHKTFLELYKKEIQVLVIGHLHPSVIISDKARVKKEKYKCFLIGKFKNKETIILPSFLATVEGASVNEYAEAYEDGFSIIPKKSLINFKVHVVGEDKVYEFGKVKDLD